MSNFRGRAPSGLISRETGNYFPDTINKTSSIFKHSLWQRNLSTIQQNYINKLIKLRSEVSNW